MMFIKKSPMQKLETVLATLRERSGRLASKQDTARDTLAAAMSARELWMIEGDLDDAKRAANLQSAVEAAQNVLAGINGAMVTLPDYFATKYLIRINSSTNSQPQRCVDPRV